MAGEVAIIGAGSWGTALANLLGRKNYPVSLWARDRTLAEAMQKSRSNPRYLQEITLPPGVLVNSDLEKVLKLAEIAILALPSHAMRAVVKKAKAYLNKETILVSVAKGIEEESLKRMSEVISEELSFRFNPKLAVLSGPNHAEEVSKDIPTATVVSTWDKGVGRRLQDTFMTPYFRVYTNPDIIGVELGGALKNVVAIAAGISDGLGYGDNTKASLITRGLAEMTRLGVTLGASVQTFAGLSGMGDLIVTCISPYSRNRAVGEKLGRGQKLEEILKETPMVAEGIRTSKAVIELAKKHQVEMPISKNVYEVLYQGKDPRTCVKDLMLREATEEIL